MPIETKKFIPTPENLINTCRRFGRFGPAYQIVGIQHKLKTGDTLMTIHIFETKEELAYPYSRILEDPTEVV